MTEEIKNYQVDRKYKVAYKRSDTKGVDGFTVEANGDDLDQVMVDAKSMYDEVKRETEEICK